MCTIMGSCKDQMVAMIRTSKYVSGNHHCSPLYVTLLTVWIISSFSASKAGKEIKIIFLFMFVISDVQNDLQSPVEVLLIQCLQLKSQVVQVVKYQPHRLCAWVGGRGLGWGGKLNVRRV